MLATVGYQAGKADVAEEIGDEVTKEKKKGEKKQTKINNRRKAS